MTTDGGSVKPRAANAARPRGRLTRIIRSASCPFATAPTPTEGFSVPRARALAAALLVLSACRVEETPDEYLNPRDPAEVEQREAAGEVAARVGAFREALARGSQADAVAALGPAADAHVMGTGFNAGRPMFGPQGVAMALAELELPRGAVARTPDLRVEADARTGQAWFATHVELLPVVGAGSAPQRLRVSGVFVRHEGDWRLEQLHLSHGQVPPVLPAPDSTSADSAAADSATEPPAP